MHGRLIGSVECVACLEAAASLLRTKQVSHAVLPASPEVVPVQPCTRCSSQPHPWMLHIHHQGLLLPLLNATWVFPKEQVALDGRELLAACAPGAKGSCSSCSSCSDATVFCVLLLVLLFGR